MVGLQEMQHERCRYTEILKMNLNLLRFSEDMITNPAAMDQTLTKSLIQDIPDSVLCIGASLCIPGGVGPSGGILGNPQQAAEPSQGEFERIREDLFLMTTPGGPGLAINAPFSNCRSLMDSLVFLEGWPDIPRLLTGLKKNNIPLLIGVTDGTGTRLPGAVLVYSLEELMIK